MVLCVRQPDAALASQLASIEPGVDAFGSSQAMDLISANLATQLGHTLSRIGKLTRFNFPWIHGVDHGRLKEDPEAVLKGLLTWLHAESAEPLGEILSRGVAETQGHVSQHKYETKSLSDGRIGACHWDAYRRILRNIDRPEDQRAEQPVAYSNRPESH